MDIERWFVWIPIGTESKFGYVDFPLGDGEPEDAAVHFIAKQMKLSELDDVDEIRVANFNQFQTQDVQRIKDRLRFAQVIKEKDKQYIVEGWKRNG